ncbi:MAG: S-layer homology domain-containing protein, partial [Clostridia bacterium]|nr:S-layer homology domain-containing protein [Clostridia bacterium]
SATTFSPEEGCTRGQVVTFLWRAAGCPEPAGSKNPFRDVKADDYFYKAVLWAVENEITNGTSAKTFSPEETCTRGQIVTFLWRASGSPSAGSASNPFKDVKAADYFRDAVLWAVAKGVTLGTDKTHFSPEDTCTRGQVVTFLYRAKN